MTKKPVRSRNAAATRAAILTAARAKFAERGYDGAGLREIAGEAGVTAMMINRYFGAKEELFAEVVTASMRDPVILEAKTLAAPDLARALSRALVGVTEPNASPLDGFLILLRSASSARAAEIARTEIEKAHQRTMSKALEGRYAGERAALFLSLVAGLAVMRQAIALTPLAKAKPATLEALLTPMIQTLLVQR